MSAEQMSATFQLKHFSRHKHSGKRKRKVVVLSQLLTLIAVSILSQCLLKNGKIAKVVSSIQSIVNQSLMVYEQSSQQRGQLREMARPGSQFLIFCRSWLLFLRHIQILCLMASSILTNIRMTLIVFVVL